MIAKRPFFIMGQYFTARRMKRVAIEAAAGIMTEESFTGGGDAIVKTATGLSGD
jgi:hypothetical protein